VLDISLKNLSVTEERLISPRIPFMLIKSAGIKQQNILAGNVVNVPMDVIQTVQLLPRAMNESHTFLIEWRRILKREITYFKEDVNLAKIEKAIRYLVKTDLYIKHGIVLDENWLKSHSLSESFVDKILESENDDILNNLNIVIEDEDNFWDERSDEERQETTNSDTLLVDYENKGLIIAPGEGNMPRSILYDEDSTQLSFPTIYGGYKYSPFKNISVSKMARHQLRNRDRRAVRSDYLFYLMKQAQTQRIAGAINLCLRKKTSNLTASDVLSNFTKIENLIQHNDGYKFLKQERNSPPYWEEQKRKVMAMIRQLGKPTFFLTLSAAETQWTPLLKALMLNIHHKSCSDEEIDQLSFQEKCTLIKTDPVTCARYFNHRIRKLFSFLKKDFVFESYQILDWYIRDEFQDRGSPHVHCFLWLKNAPNYVKNDKDSIKKCVVFIDKFINCPATNPNVDEKFIKYQNHKHSFTCKKYLSDLKTCECRFNYPQFPMKQTMILEPLDFHDSVYSEDDIQKQIANLKETYKFVKQNISIQIKNKNLDLSFEEFLKDLNLSHEKYIEVIRSELKHAKVFLQRSLKDVKINCYNSKILNLHEGNMDMQFMIDAYACARYVSDYMNKVHKGMSKLLRCVSKEISLGNMDLKKQFQKISNTYVKKLEISAQEAVYYLLGLPVSQCSRLVSFINTNLPENRVHVVKPPAQLKLMDSNDTDILSIDIIEYYSYGSEKLSFLCLADFVANFDIECKQKSTIVSNEDEINEDETNENQIDETSNIKTKHYFLSGSRINKSKYARERKQSKIIRFVKYDRNKNESEYYRELIMLYLPWRNELSEVINIDHLQIYLLYSHTIELNQAKYFFYTNKFIEEIEDQIKNDLELKIIESKDEKTILIEDKSFAILACQKPDIDIYETMGISVPKADITKELIVRNKLSSVNLIKLLTTLNVKQNLYLYNLLYRIKLKRVPLFDFISGQAGVGKSKLIQAIFHGINNYFNYIDNSEPDNPRILLTAPTGLAAFNFEGFTLHSAFGLPVNQNNDDMLELSKDALNSYYSKYKKLKLLIIDEISVTSNVNFHQVNQRLQQVFNNKIHLVVFQL